MEKPNNYSIKYFHGAYKIYYLVCEYKKIVILKQIEKSLVEWYHDLLCHPGETRTKLSIGQYFYWKGAHYAIHNS